MGTAEAFTGVGAVAGQGSRKAAADAEGRRIGAEHGLGECRGAADKSASVLPGKIAAGVLLVIMPWYAAVVAGLKFVVAPGYPGTAGRGAGLVIIAIGLGIGAPLMAVMTRKRQWSWQYSYEGGFAEVRDRPRRLTVVRWADLASMSLSVVRGYDDEYVGGCELRDHAGNAVTVGGDAIGRAEQVLTRRLVGPLTGQLDAGLPVTVGCLTVDRWGIRCHGGRPWEVPWPQVNGIETRLHGQRASVKTGHRGRRQAAFDGQPNGFLAGYALEHAARKAGVPLSAE